MSITPILCAPARVLPAIVASLQMAGLSLAAPPVSDDFDRANLDLARWSFVNPLGDGSLAMVGADTGDASVRLSIPTGASHDPWQVNRSVRIMQPADDADFEVEVFYDSEPSQRYQMQGVIVEQDEDDWLRFEILSDGSGLRVYAARTVAGSSSGALDVNIDPGDGSALRVTRTGDQWTIAYLNGATTWQTAGSFAHAMTVTSVGPYVANHASSGDSPGFTAIIDDFQNTASPIASPDDGAPADVDGPFIHNIGAGATGPNELTFTFATDEPATGTVRIGTTTAYELGDFTGAPGLSNHAIAIPGLTPGETYHFMIEAQDALTNTSTTDDAQITFAIPGAPVIDIWYGDEQTFGVLGQPQPWINILGNVSDPDTDITSLTYQLNGAMTAIDLTTGSDGRRLENAGDFNVDLASADLTDGVNTIVITATDSIGNMTEKTVTVNYTSGTVWPLPYDIDWSELQDIDEIQDVGQVVDGKWRLEEITTGDPLRTTATFLRTEEPGYDRLFAIGDRTWTDYEFEVPIVIHSTPGSFGAGVLLRWDGHTDNPIAGRQPKTGYLPLGCILWCRPGKIELYGNGGQILDSQTRSILTDTLYMLKGRVVTIDGVGGLYSMKLWEAGNPEPTEWQITGQEALSDPQAGSMLLIAHLADVSFGEVTVTSLEPSPDITPPVISDVQVSATPTTATITWVTDEAANSLVEYGLSPSYDMSASSSPFVLNHSIQLMGLAPNTTYHFRVGSTDTSGNTTFTSDMTFTTDEAGLLADIVGDEFDGSELNTDVWTFINGPPADGSYAIDGGALCITVPAGVEHQVWIGGIQVPRIVQTVQDGDFEVVLKMNSELLSQYQEQGIVIEQDADSYLRFELYSQNSGLRIFAAAIRDGVGSIKINGAISLQPPYYMRVKREGDMWLQEYSDDGDNWLQGASFSDPLEMTSIGLYAGNALAGSSPAHTACFDWFRVIELPCPGDINGDNTVDLADFNVLGINFGTGPGATLAQGDLSGDGLVNLTDFNILGTNFGNTCP